MLKSVSIVIPCRNEEKYIGLCLNSIVNTTYPKDKLEVFVCDGRSSDRTLDIVNEFVQNKSYIKLLINEKQTTPVALNLGIKASKSDAVIILGAHAELYPDYIERCVEVLNKDSVIGCAGGIIENINEDARTEVIAKAMSSSFGVGNAHFRTGEKEGYVDTVAFGCYKREVFEKIGLFDEELTRNQDDEFNYRLIKGGYKIYLSHKIRSKYYVRSSYKNLFRQYYQYGYWKVYVNYKHKTVTTVRQIIPAIFVLFIIINGLLALKVEFFKWTLLIGLSLYLLIAFYSAFRKSSKLKTTFKIIMVFFILHFSYGIGYIEAIIDFFLLRKKMQDRKSIMNR